jgi:hypothetical protein
LPDGCRRSHHGAMFLATRNDRKPGNIVALPSRRYITSDVPTLADLRRQGQAVREPRAGYPLTHPAR